MFFYAFPPVALFAPCIRMRASHSRSSDAPFQDLSVARVTVGGTRDNCATAIFHEDSFFFSEFRCCHLQYYCMWNHSCGSSGPSAFIDVVHVNVSLREGSYSNCLRGTLAARLAENMAANPQTSGRSSQGSSMVWHMAFIYSFGFALHAGGFCGASLRGPISPYAWVSLVRVARYFDVNFLTKPSSLSLYSLGLPFARIIKLL